MKNVIPSRGAATIATSPSLNALDAVTRLGDANPYARSLGTVAKQVQDGSAVVGAVILINTNTGKVIATDGAAAKTAMRAAPGTSDVVVLTPTDLGNATHEWTASGANLEDVLGVDGAALFLETAITARKPKRSTKQIIEDLNTAAELGAKKLNILCDLPNGVVKGIEDSGANLNTHTAAVVTDAPVTGLFTVVEGTEATEPAAADPVLDI